MVIISTPPDSSGWIIGWVSEGSSNECQVLPTYISHPRGYAASGEVGAMEPGCSSGCWRRIWAGFFPPVWGPLCTSNELSASAQKMGAALWGKGRWLLFLHIFSTGATLANYKWGKVEVGGRVSFLFTSSEKKEDTLSAITWCHLPFISSFLSISGSYQSWPQRESNCYEFGLDEVLIRET